MKRFRFLVPVGIAAASLLGGNANAQPQTQQAPVIELRNADQQLPERTLLMKVTDQGAIHAYYGAQHVSHYSHVSHASHSSHSSHTSGF
jgi:hypothetical protein